MSPGGLITEAEGGWKASNEHKTLYICDASSLRRIVSCDPRPPRALNSYLVGEMMIAPTWCFLIGSSNRSNFSTTGMRKAMVFPLPVTASTTTSLWPMKRGIAEACTGVMRVKPMEETASRIHSESGGVRASHALEDDEEGGFGAIAHCTACAECPSSRASCRKHALELFSSDRRSR